jgi:hypothetical protein
MKILMAIKIHIVIFSIMRPYSLVLTKPLKEHNSCNFTKKLPIVKRNDVIRNTAITYIRIALLLKINMKEMQEWDDSLFIDNTTLRGQGY